jgi:hypothetical protein
MTHALQRLRLMVQMVTNLVFDSDGNATAEGADGESIDPTVGYHFGFYSRPLDGARGVVIKADGQGNTSFLFAYRDKQYEMTLQKGECGVQNAFGANVLLNSNGEVVFNGGKKQVARVDDTTQGGWLYFVPNVPPGGAATLAYLPPDTTPMPTPALYPAPGILMPLTGKIATGASKVLG